jgi:hypothetical protein
VRALHNIVERDECLIWARADCRHVEDEATSKVRGRVRIKCTKSFHDRLKGGQKTATLTPTHCGDSGGVVLINYDAVVKNAKARESLNGLERLDVLLQIFSAARSVLLVLKESERGFDLI